MFASVNYGQIWSWNRGHSSRSSVLTVKETHHNLQIHFQVCFTENQVFWIFKKLEGWMGGVWHWIFFSHGFQHTFSFKTVAKALDSDLGFCVVLHVYCRSGYFHQYNILLVKFSRSLIFVTSMRICICICTRMHSYSACAHVQNILCVKSSSGKVVDEKFLTTKISRSTVYGATGPLFVCMWLCPTSSARYSFQFLIGDWVNIIELVQLRSRFCQLAHLKSEVKLSNQALSWAFSLVGLQETINY